MLIHPGNSPFEGHWDRSSDDFGHNENNISLVCMVFNSPDNFSTEQWFQILLDQLLVPLTNGVRALVSAELSRLAEGGRMTAKHAFRMGKHAELVAAGDDSFSH